MRTELHLAATMDRAPLRPSDDAIAWAMVAPALVLMLTLYVYPVLQVLAISVTEPKPGLANYAEIVDSGAVQRVLWTTARICFVTTTIAVFLGYVVSYVMTACSAGVQRAILAIVVLPLWISALVRAFAWVVLLRREGVVNMALQGLGISQAPVALVWNENGVTIGMVHYMLPYAILPLYANMRDIDRRCITAARGLGASRFQAFHRIFLPLSVPGIVAAAALVLVYSLGFFIIPAILGGGKTLMIAEYVWLQISELLNWGRGTMLAVVLLITVAALLGTVVWLVGARRLFGGGHTRARILKWMMRSCRISASSSIRRKFLTPKPKLLQNNDWVRSSIKSEIFVNAYGQEEGLKVKAEADPEVLKALDLLPQAKQLAEKARELVAQRTTMTR